MVKMLMSIQLNELGSLHKSCKIPELRAALSDRQHAFAQTRFGCEMAEIWQHPSSRGQAKIYLTVSAQSRAETSKAVAGYTGCLNDILANIEARINEIWKKKARSCSTSDQQLMLH